MVGRGWLVGVRVRALGDHRRLGEDDALRVVPLEGIAEDRRLIVRDPDRFADQQREREREDDDRERLRPCPPS